MRINTLKLKNFRRFEDATFEFGPGFNLLVGENGSGKSSVLSAIFGTIDNFGYAANDTIEILTYPLVEDTRLSAPDVKSGELFEKIFPCQIECEVVEFENVNHVIKLERKNDLFRGFMPNNISEYWHQVITSLNNVDVKILPLLSYFSINRNKKSLENFDFIKYIDTPASRRDGYLGWRAAGQNISPLKIWYFFQTVEKLAKIKDNFQPDHKSSLDIVVSAIGKCVEGCSGLYFHLQQRVLYVEWHDRDPTPFDTLSDGQRGLIMMVADIARRACLLNPQLEEKALEETPGIVLIDELDLHLHPKWQRSIVKNLKNTFPKIQFIATTHSPQIIGECKPEEIMVVTETGGKGGVGVDLSYGLDSNSILERIMDTRERDPDIEEFVDQLFLAIDERRFDDAASALTELEAKVGEIPEVIRARRLIHRHHRRNSEAAE